MSKLYLLFGVHNHQPVGNFDWVFEDSYERCYLPFFQTLKGYDKVKCNVHISGPLWDWIKHKKKDGFLNLLKELKEKGQVEFLSGGYYEPILPLIPEEDRLRQIRMMNEFLKKEFKEDPKGLWLAERVWEPGLASSIKDAGLEFTLVDDAHFRYAGEVFDDLPGYFHTENLGKAISLFPISKRLRYKIPFSKIEETKQILKGLKEKFPDQIITIVDDGEKFGIWPQTYDWVHNKGWLKKFFALLEECSDWIETLTFSQALAKFSSRGIIYLPTASYDEMMEWVLEPEAQSVFEEVRKDAVRRNPGATTFLRGGFFRNFARKYPDINYMHKRMLNISKNIKEKLKGKDDDKITRPLLKGQCNCAYWHGIFGGFYLGHLRHAVYENLIEAEKMLDKRSKDGLSAVEEDIDLDGQKEIILKNKDLTLEVAPAKGGSLEELSFKPLGFNFLNTFTRRKESYHAKLNRRPVSVNADKAESIHNVLAIKEKGLERFLIYDPYRKVSLIDHLIDKHTDSDKIALYRGLKTLISEAYSPEILKDKEKIELKLKNKRNDLTITKSITLYNDQAKVGFSYQVDLHEKNTLITHDFAVEFNLFILAVDNSFIRINNRDNISIKEKAFLKDVTSLEIIDEYKKSNLRFDLDPLNIALIPIYSVSSSEGGFEKNLQQVCLFFIKDLENSNKFAINLKIEKI